MRSEPERDRSVERLLRQSLDPSVRQQPPGSCPDTETLAAWVDGALAGSQLAAVDAHLADCGRCQSLVAGVVRAQPELPAAELWWRGWLRTRWLVPVAATAAAVAIWVAVPDEQFSPPLQQPSEEGRSARLQTPSPPQSAEPPVDARTSAEFVDAAEAPVGRMRAVEQEASALKSEVEEAVPPAEGQARLDESSDAVDRAAANELPAVDRALRAPDATEAPAELRGVEMAQGARRAAQASALEAAPQAANARRESQPAQFLAEILSPDPSSRWRIGTAGAVEYSANGGSTWEATSSGTAADFTAGASPSRTVCWIVGRQGTVLLTTDGRRWQRVPFPVTVDLTAVQSTDASNATVIAADDRRFTTADGGATWR